MIDVPDKTMHVEVVAMEREGGFVD